MKTIKTDGKDKTEPDKTELEKSGPENTKVSPGRLYVVGMGPGSLDGMTKEAFKGYGRQSGDCRIYGVCRPCKALFSRERISDDSYDKRRSKMPYGL